MYILLNTDLPLRSTSAWQYSSCISVSPESPAISSPSWWSTWASTCPSTSGGRCSWGWGKSIGYRQKGSGRSPSCTACSPFSSWWGRSLSSSRNSRPRLELRRSLGTSMITVFSSSSITTTCGISSHPQVNTDKQEDLFSQIEILYSGLFYLFMFILTLEDYNQDQSRKKIPVF